MMKYVLTNSQITTEINIVFDNFALHPGYSVSNSIAL